MPGTGNSDMRGISQRLESWWRIIGGVVAVVLVPVSIVYLVKANPQQGWVSRLTLSVTSGTGLEATTKQVNIMPLLVYCAWTIGPPIWFYLEYLYFLTRLPANELAALKYSQDLAQKIWGGIAVVLGIVLLVKYNIKI